MVDEKKLLPVAPYDLYIAGLENMMKEKDGKKLTLDEARQVLLDNLNKVQGYHHIPLLEAAYQKLKTDQH